MPRVVERAHIAASPEEVHAFIQDLDRYPEWIPFADEVTRVEHPEDGGVVGTRYWEQGTGGESSWEIIAYDEGEREVHEGDIGIATVRIEMEMAPDGDGGTDYTHRIAYDPKLGPVGWLVDKLVLGRKMRTGTHELVANLERIIEQESS